MSTPPAPSTRQYAVFISYRHADNKDMGRKWANWLHEALESYEVPPDLIGKPNLRGDKVVASLYPVFRDEEELPADADLSTNIRRALENSGLLVVLCSPRAVQSRFVADEIRYFKEIGKSHRILALMLDGEPNASDDPAKIEQYGAAMECFPEPLRFGVAADNDPKRIDWNARTEPIAADVRPEGRAVEGWTTAPAYQEQLVKAGELRPAQITSAVSDYAERLELAKLKVVAGALGVPLGELTQRNKAYQLAKAKRRQKIIATMAAVFGVLAILAAGAGWVAWTMRNKADAKAHELSDTLGIYSFYEGSNRLRHHETTQEALAYLSRGAREYQNQNCADRILTFIQQRPLWVLTPSNEPKPPVAEYPRRELPSGIDGPLINGEKGEVKYTFDGPGGLIAVTWGAVEQESGAPFFFRIWDAANKPLTEWIEPKAEADSWQGEITKIIFSPGGDYVAVRIARWRQPECLQVFHVTTAKQVGGTVDATGEGTNTQSAAFTHVSFTPITERQGVKTCTLLAGSTLGDLNWLGIEDDPDSSSGIALNEVAVVHHHHAITSAVLARYGEEGYLITGSDDGKVNISTPLDEYRGTRAATLTAGRNVEDLYLTSQGVVEVVGSGQHYKLEHIPNLALGLAMPPVPAYETGESAPNQTAIKSKEPEGVQFVIPDGVSPDQIADESVRVQPVPLCVRFTHADRSVTAYAVDATFKNQLVAKGQGTKLLLPQRKPATPLEVGNVIADITTTRSQDLLVLGFQNFSYRVFSTATGAPASALMDESKYFSQGGQASYIESMRLSPSATRLLTRSQHWEPPNAMLSYIMIWDCATGVPMADRVNYADDAGNDQPHEGKLYIDDTSAVCGGVIRFHATKEEFETLAAIAENLSGLQLNQSREFHAVEQSPEALKELFAKLKAR